MGYFIAIDQLNPILKCLKKGHFSESRWMKLGVTLGLQKSRLDTIESDYQYSERRLIECISLWLKTGGCKNKHTWDDLLECLTEMDEIEAVKAIQNFLQPTTTMSSTRLAML